ncbi:MULTISPECIES: DUF5133 domain-containing protein [unclassified Streptomyces]|uniref:DUF5133 domain-containing protein n=1 Tax=unclassified Streptomyces TaxID=2593676 RepID=UPI002E37DE19|nr:MULTISPECIES: DUF5133 domain-containing protein [unclassified Streptomyces]WUC67831.1 DUF5133 domain-containing protein [Streptomyces sp. NBC_00539]
MLMAHPAVLSGLVERYWALAVLCAHDDTPQTRGRMDDVAHTLCVATGTSSVDAALAAARYRLPGARTFDDSVLAS